MFSHIRGRLLRSSFVESTLRFSTSASCLSEKGNGNDPKVIVGVSRPVKDGSKADRVKNSGAASSKLLDDVLEASFTPQRRKGRNREKNRKFFEEETLAEEYAIQRMIQEDDIQACFAQPRRANFQRKSERGGAQRKQLSQMKPGQLNIKMVDAAKKVAAQAGQEEKKVLNDIMSKLDDVFVGMNAVRPGIKQTAREKPSHTDSPPGFFVNESSGVSDRNAKEFDDLFNEGQKSVVVADKPRGGEFSEFVGAKTLKEFQSIEELLKLESPLKIFKEDQKSPEPEPSTWQTLEKAEILRATRFEPLNWFDQCIVWTEEGKLWHFPINNEQGMDEEAEIDFTEHIFLDHHIEHWCPKEGPIKHFMELVTVGLSKNPYITVAKKKETLQWYENYFLQNQALLEEIDAFGKEKEQ